MTGDAALFAWLIGASISFGFWLEDDKLDGPGQVFFLSAIWPIVVICAIGVYFGRFVRGCK